jgi:hypothetical protein
VSDDIPRLLGQIDGKLDQLIKGFDKHEDDDVRRFTDTYKKIDEIKEDINKAKGAKGAFLLAAGGIASAAALVAPLVAKALGLK